MANMVTNILKVPDLRSRVFFTIFCLIVYRIGAHITTPGINPVGLQELIESLNTKGPWQSHLLYRFVCRGGF